MVIQYNIASVFVFFIVCVEFGNVAKVIEKSKTEGNATLVYNTDAATWTRAAECCSSKDESLLRFKSTEPGKIINDLGLVKRTIDIQRDNGSWIGFFTTYTILDGQDYPVNKSVEFCVAIHINSVSVLEGKTYVYKFELITMDCTATHGAICTSDKELVRFQNDKMEWTASCSKQSGSRLWKPMNYTSIRVARNGEFAVGNFSSTAKNPALLDKYFWVNLIIKETPSMYPVSGDILQCGYISYYGTGIDYTNCYDKKDFICEADIIVNRGEDQKASVGLYAGVSVAGVVVIAVAVVVIVCIMRTKNKISENWKSEAKLPEGGRSFTRKHTDDESRPNVDNRITTYNQISWDRDNVTAMTNDSVDVISDQGHPAYASVKKTSKKGNKPDVVPRQTKQKNPGVSRPGYLTMDGRGSNPTASDKEYDFLESTLSTGSKRYTHLDTGDTSNNVYSSTSETYDSTYNVTFQRGSSQKRLINEDYDHVSFEGGSATMNKRMCDSINAETHSTTVQTSQPMSNPGYESHISIKVKR